VGKHRREGANLTCTLQGHTWKKNGHSGKSYPYWETEAFKNGGKYSTWKDEVFQCYCARNCGSFHYMFENWDHELSREEKARLRIQDRGFTAAMIWMLNGDDEEDMDE
jgi:hypothetical protein